MDKNIEILDEFMNQLTFEKDQIKARDLINLVKENKKISSILSQIVKDNKSLIEEEKLEEMVSNQNTLEIIDIYCDINHIELKKKNTNNDYVEDFFYTDAFKAYQNEVNKYPLLTKEQEIELGKRIKENKDMEAVKELAKHNLRFVASVAKKYKESIFTLDELIEIGNCGLMAGIRKFDYEKGRFTTYIAFWIRQAIENAIYTNSQKLYVPQDLSRLIYKVEWAKYVILTSSGKEATEEEIAKFLKIKVDDVKEAIKASQKMLSLDVVPNDDDDCTLESIIPDENVNVEDEAIKSLIKEEIIKIIDTFPQFDKEIIMYHYGFNKTREYTISEIAKLLNITRKKVETSLERSYKSIRENEDFAYLKDYIICYKNGNNKKRFNKTIYDLLYSVCTNVDKINEAIAKLDEKDKETINIMYGNDLYNPQKDPDKYSTKVYYRLYRTVLPKIKRNLKS